jgi:hypothetical protein
MMMAKHCSCMSTNVEQLAFMHVATWRRYVVYGPPNPLMREIDSKAASGKLLTKV